MTGTGSLPPDRARSDVDTLDAADPGVDPDRGPEPMVDAAPFGGAEDDPGDPVVIADEPVVVSDGDGPDDDHVGGTRAPGAPVDPRMQRRWIDQRRSEGRRRLRILSGVIAFVSVALLAWVVAHSSLLGMETVEVHGTARVDPAAVRSAAAIDDGAPLLFLDDAAVARRVERLPGVATAKVRTELPGTVVIEVVERQPVAWANAPAPDAVALIDATGKVIARVPDPPTGLLRLDGVTAGTAGSRVEHADSLRRIGRLPVALRLMTDHFALTPRGDAVLVLRAGEHGAARVVLGDGTATAHKGDVALAVLADLQGRGEQRDTVDVSVPDAPVVR